MTDNLIALAVTGIIWSRYSTQIVPVNYSLLAVNACVAGTALVQLSRVGVHKLGVISAMKKNENN